MKNTFIYIAGIIICIATFISVANSKELSNEPLAAYKLNGLWHFIDYEGNLMFEPQPLVNIGGYGNDYFMVIAEIDGENKWCYMDLAGEIVIITEADKLRNFSDDMAIIIREVEDQQIGEMYGYINSKGEIVADTKFYAATDFIDGLAWVVEKDRRGYINKSGEYVMEFEEYNFGYPFFEDLAAMSDSRDIVFGYINRKGEKVIDFEYDEVRNFSDGLAAVNIEGKFGFINKHGDMVIQPQWEFALDFVDGHCFVGLPQPGYIPIWGVINRAGTLLKGFEYNDVRQFNDGIGVGRKDDTYYFIDLMGEPLFGQSFSYAEGFSKGLAWASIHQEEKYGFIDPTGNFVITIPKADVMVDLRINKRVF
jgi:hypothetical protein